MKNITIHGITWAMLLDSLQNVNEIAAGKDSSVVGLLNVFCSEQGLGSK